ncbi:MAG: hypothetical protein QOE87_1119 [Gaiellales bacterium]|jgi:hypothetical protein|nr:hypothetical protein [Gaiellales bacterium]
MRAGIFTRTGVALTLCAVVAPASAQAACSSSVTRTSTTATIPSGYLALYQKWGSAYGVPWQLLAAVGSVESRHGRDPGAYVPHTRGVLGPMQFQAGSNKAARRVDAAGNQGFGGTWGMYRKSSGHPPYRMDDADDEIAAAAAKLAYDSDHGRLWPRALWRYNALHSYRKTVLRRAARLGMSSACGLLAQSEQASLSPRAESTPASTAAASTPEQSNLARALAATPGSLLSDNSLAFAPPAADDIAHHVADTRLVALLAWMAQRHGVVVTVIRTGHARYVAGTHKVSNHWYGRAATISEVDGRPVSAGSEAAAALWNELLTAPKALRPDEIGAPWSSPANPRWFTGPGEKSTLHVGFDAVGAKKG